MSDIEGDWNWVSAGQARPGDIGYVPPARELPVWNVCIPVVDLIRADSEAGAVAELRARLASAGFSAYDGECSGPGAFLSEDQDDS
jgi:hypothetical protein